MLASGCCHQAEGSPASPSFFMGLSLSLAESISEEERQGRSSTINMKNITILLQWKLMHIASRCTGSMIN